MVCWLPFLHLDGQTSATGAPAAAFPLETAGRVPHADADGEECEGPLTLQQTAAPADGPYRFLPSLKLFSASPCFWALILNVVWTTPVPPSSLFAPRTTQIPQDSLPNSLQHLLRPRLCLLASVLDFIAFLVTSASLLPLEFIRHAPASGPLHLLPFCLKYSGPRKCLFLNFIEAPVSNYLYKSLPHPLLLLDTSQAFYFPL